MKKQRGKRRGQKEEQAKPKGGRPLLLTPETMARLRDALKVGSTIAMACANARISTSTYHSWIAKARTEGGLYAELKVMARECYAQVNIAAMKQIDAAADPSEDAEGHVVPGDWKAAAWRVERVERILRDQDEEPDVVRAHQWRKAEWRYHKFQGGPSIVRRKINFLAHMEVKLTVNWTCRAARVHRYEFAQWMADDPVFNAGVSDATIVAAYQAEEMLLKGALTLDKDGKVQTTAVFGILNAKSIEYGLLKAMLYARTNAKLLDEIASELFEGLPADTVTKLRERLAGIQQKACGLPPGSSVR